MKSALQRFSEKGMDATTIEDITELADLGKGTFYRHFSGKEDILSALVEDVVDQLVERLDERCSGASNLEEALSQMLRAHNEFFLGHWEEFVLLFQGRLLLKLERDDTDQLERPYTRYLAEIETRLAQFVPERVEPRRIRRLAYAVVGFVSGYLSFATIGLSTEEVESGLRSLRQACIRVFTTILTQSPPVVAAASPTPSAAPCGQNQDPERCID
jgi:AcrR family transcriptional regulator